MLQQEAAGQNSINVEPSNGAMDITTTTLQEFVTMTTATTNAAIPQPMDQDALVAIATPPACLVQAPGQQPTAPPAVNPQMFASCAMSSAPVNSLGNLNIFYNTVLQIVSHFCHMDTQHVQKS